MAINAEQIQTGTHPVPIILSYGFRPFFILAAIWAVLGMALWIPMLSGHDILPLGFDPFSWHAHEFIFGYTSAVIAGFLLTAVPNWTRSAPVRGWPLAILVILWLVGRLAIAFSGLLPWILVAVLDLSAFIGLAALVIRGISRSRNWRNLPVIGILLLFSIADLVFLIEAGQGGYAANGYGMRIGLAAVVMLISFIGGRIIPMFTRNWLISQGVRTMPVLPNRADQTVLVLTALSLPGFIMWPGSLLVNLLLAVAGLANLWRLSRWGWQNTLAEPLVWVLHLGYLMLSLGFLAVAAAGFDLFQMAAARHVWMAGGIGVMTLAMMSRVSLGHTGRAIQGGTGTILCYLALFLSVVLRVAVGFWPGGTPLLHMAALFWILGFGGFALLYGPLLFRPRLG